MSKDGGKLAFELRLFNAVREQCEMEQLGVRAADVGSCEQLLIRVRDALWLMSGRRQWMLAARAAARRRCAS